MSELSPTQAVLEEIAAECQQQFEAGVLTPERVDKEFSNGKLARMASSYVFMAGVSGTILESILQEQSSSVGDAWREPSTSRSVLIKAAALIVAEIERRDRKEKQG